MTDGMKEALNVAIKEVLFVEGNLPFDSNMTEHVIDLMVDAAEAVFDMAAKMNAFLMGS